MNIYIHIFGSHFAFSFALSIFKNRNVLWKSWISGFLQHPKDLAPHPPSWRRTIQRWATRHVFSSWPYSSLLPTTPSLPLSHIQVLLPGTLARTYMYRLILSSSSASFCSQTKSPFTCKSACPTCIVSVKVCLTNLTQISYFHFFLHSNTSYFIDGSITQNALWNKYTLCGENVRILWLNKLRKLDTTQS